MQCPACSHFRLKPIKLEAGLPAISCSKCQGALVPLVTYRAWAERQPPVSVQTGAAPTTVQDSKSALRCPKCSKLMMKYRIGSGVENRVDLCPHCDEAWLDAGEWQLLGQLQYHSSLASIMTEPWQRRLREQEREEVVARKYLALLGTQDWQRLQEVGEWVAGHPRKQDLLRYLLRDSS